MKTANRTRRALVAFTFAFAFASAGAAIAPMAQAADQRYAVMSLIGDEVAVVSWRPKVGSNIDRNERQAVSVKEGTFDRLALLAVDDRLRHADPKANPVLLAVRDPRLFAAQERMLDRDGDVGELLETVKGLLAQSQATRLILVSKYRGDAKFEMQDLSVGSGKLAGLGFYVDTAMRVQNISTGSHGQGFIAPFAYLALTLIDARTMTPIKRVVAPESFVVSTAQSKTATAPWDALSAQDKVEALDRLVRQAVAAAMPELLAAQ